MEADLRVLPPEELMEQLLGVLDVAEQVPLVISGSSMYPFLHHRRDTVYLSKVTAPLKAGDMILYRRPSGQYVLHRILRAGKGTYDLLGDRQMVVEPGIRDSQVLAVVTAVRRDGKLLRPGDRVWDFYEKCWISMIRLRPWLIRGYNLLTGHKPEQ